MAYAQRIITSNSAGDQEFTFTFDYIKEEHIKVFVNFVEKTQGTGSDQFQVISNTTPKKISLNTGLASNNTRVEIRRVSSLSTPLVDFVDGSTLTAADLDTAEKQSLFIDQELDDALKQGVSIDGSTGLPSLTNQRLSNVADPVGAQDTVTKNYLERAGSITSTQIADGTIVDGDIANATITGSKLVNNTVTSTQIAADAVGASELANNAVDTTAIQDGNVTRPKIANDAIDGTKIEDDAVNSEHIAADSIDAEHYAPGSVDTTAIATNAVTSNEIADNAVTNAKIADAELKTLAGMPSGTASKLADSTVLTSDIADLNQLDGLQKETTITDDDTKFPTSGAVIDYVAAQLAPIGGLEAIANENSFPNTQPQSGVVISIADAGGLSVASDGTASGQTVGGTTVNISGIASNFRGSSVAAGVRFLVVSTGSGQNYTYHKATLKEDDLVGLSGDINDFAERYRVGSSFPTSNNDSGDLFWHTSLGKLYVYNGTTSAFEETQSIGNFFISTLSPAFDGSTTNFTLSNAPTSAQQVLLIIEGVLQKPNAGTSTPTEGFALDGSTVKLAAAPATGASYHAVVMGTTVNIGTPSNNTVTTAILQNNSVSAGKIQADAIDGSKIADDSINSEHYVDGSIDADHIANDAITTPKIKDNDVTTLKLSNDAVTAAKLAADAVVTTSIVDDAVTNAKIADDAITTAKIADDAVTADKLANSINSAIAANTAKDLTALSASNLTSGTIPDARFPSTLPAISAANLTNLPASGRAKNLVVNGAMNVSQRGSAATVVSGIQSCDRFAFYFGGEDEPPNQSRVDVASGTTPYSLGFRKALQIQNGNQTGGAGTNDYCFVQAKLEAQNIAKSGWNYTSASSYITLSFWVKSSVAQSFKFYLRTHDGTGQVYSMDTGTLSANTWTKVTKTIPGNSNLQFDNDTLEGLSINWIQYFGTGSSDNSGTEDQWRTYNTSDRIKDMTSTWWTTNDATFQLTGVLLELGQTASDYPHLTYAEDLVQCQRYFYSAMNAGGAGEYMSWGIYLGSGKMMSTWYLPTEMRANPTVSYPEGTNYYNIYRADGSDQFNSLGSILGPNKFAGNHFVNIEILSLVGSTGGYSGTISAGNSAVYVHFSAEI